MELPDTGPLDNISLGTLIAQAQAMQLAMQDALNGECSTCACSTCQTMRAIAQRMNLPSE